MNINDHEPPMKLSELARRLGVEVRWLRAEADRGALPHVRAGKGILFDRATIERILAERAKVEGVARG